MSLKGGCVSQGHRTEVLSGVPVRFVLGQGVSNDTRPLGTGVDPLGEREVPPGLTDRLRPPCLPPSPPERQSSPVLSWRHEEVGVVTGSVWPPGESRSVPGVRRIQWFPSLSRHGIGLRFLDGPRLDTDVSDTR